MALRKYAPPGSVPLVGIKPLNFSSKVHENAQHADAETRVESDTDIDLREVYFLIMHFLSSGPCHRTYGQLWNELLENQLLPRRYHAWYSRGGAITGDENDDGLSFPLSYNKLVDRYPHVEKDHLVKLLKQLVVNTASPSQSLVGGNALNAADVPTLLGTGSFSLLSQDRDKGKALGQHPPRHMRWPHLHSDQVRGLSLREIGGGFSRHHRAPSIRAACYTIAKPATMVQKMQNLKRLRGHRNAVYCAIFDRSGRYVITGSDDRLVKIWSMETAFCLASCRGHEGDITDLAVSSNNALVASASNDCIIRVWRLPDGLPISVLRGHSGAVTAIAFSPRPGSIYQLLSSSDDGTCRIWDARNSSFTPRIYKPRPSDLVGKNNNPSSSTITQSRQIFCCAFNANGTVFVTGSSDNLARVWNACKPSTDDSDQPNHEMDVLSGHENDVNYVQFSGCAVASRFSLSDSLKEDNVPKFRNSWLSHDNIVTCSRDGSAIIWIPRSRRSHGKVGRWIRSYHLKVPPPPMPSLPPRGGPRQRILPTPRGVNMIVWSLDNRFVLAAIMDCRICVWNASDGSLVHSLTGHTDSTYVLDVHPFNPRIAMSAGYDGKTIVWDIWEGMPIQIYEISRFKLVDGKFSSDGTSIILSDDVGQLYILNTGQGESQQDAKYDQFFLGDYRPLVQDTHGNVLDQETQLLPYRRNMQDLLCDSGMNPYPEPYQIMYQKRRLGALNIEWKPPSIKFAVGPDFSLDPDYQMLPLADLDVLVEPLPEFIDAMDWEPGIDVQSDDNDSEYNVPEEYSTGGEQGSINSSSSIDPECSGEDSEAEGKDGVHKSRRKKQRADIEVMTSSGRRVKRRNLDECDGNSFRSNRSRKSRMGQKTSRRKSSTSKALRPQRAAARNALTLFSKITGTATDGEDEDSSDGDLSEGESSLQNSSLQSDESEISLQNGGSRDSKGKEVSLESEDFVKSHEFSESPVSTGNRRRLVLKLPVRDSTKVFMSENKTTNNHEVDLVGSSSSMAPPEARSTDQGQSSSNPGRRGQLDNNHSDLLEGYKNGEIKWGGVKTRTSKRPRFGDGASLAPCVKSSDLSHEEGKENNMDDCLVSHNPNGTTSSSLVDKVYGLNIDGSATGTAAIRVTSNGNGNPHEFEKSNKHTSSKLCIKSRKTPTDSSEIQESEECKQNPDSEVPESDNTNRASPVGKCDEGQQPDAQIDETSTPSLDGSEVSGSRQKNMYTVVYKRSKLSRDRTSSGGDSGIRESISHDEHNTRSDLHKESTNGVHKMEEVVADDPTSSNTALRPEQESDDKYRNTHNGSTSRCQFLNEEWGSSSKMTVGLRSTRNRRTSYYFQDASPVDRRKSHQSSKRASWLMLSMHEEGSRYIPQLGDEVAYLRQGHQEYIEKGHINLKEPCPWKTLKGHIKAVEFCKVEGLEYSTVPSGDSCCKMTLKFVDPASNVYQKSFKLTLPELTGFPDFLVERTRFDASIERNWTCRDKCKVWWKNDGEEDGSWWAGRILSAKPKSSEFPDSPWERYTVQYRSEPTETQEHSPWELFDGETQWEQPHIDDEIRNKLISALPKLDLPVKRVQDYYGVEKLRQVSQKTHFTNRFPVPLSVDLIEARLSNNYYRTIEALKHDVEVMLSNAESYFAKSADLPAKVARLSEWFDSKLSSL
ncbi:WD40/YVTN repeat-like-containing domain Bromodomain [Euphorbia peplus]|nr:WD40/YVTN repeat-like-containing domain Bromodomain [Euphorbia peplus]